MRCVNKLSLCVSIAACVLLAACVAQMEKSGSGATGVTVYEGARLITGDGGTIENSAFVVEGNRFTRVGRRGELQVPAGAAPAQVIVAATRTSAGILGLDELGMVAAGKSADFVVLDANPLDDITNTRKISRVYLRGQQLDRAAMRAKWQSAMKVASN